MNISKGTVTACENPEIKVAFSPIRDEELEPYRKQYPVPFSDEDKARTTVRNYSPPTMLDWEPVDEQPPRQGGSERSKPPSNNNRPPVKAPSRGEGGEPPEPSYDGGNGRENRDDRSSRHPSERTEPKVPVPDKFNPRSLAEIGEVYSYEPRTVSEEECLNEILRVYIDLVNYHLIMKPATGNNNAQKTVLQNIPRPEFYYGDEDIMKFNTWLFVVPPLPMSKEMSRTVTAEQSSVNAIMQAAIKCEKGNGAYTYYAKTRASRTPQNGPSKQPYANDSRNKQNNRDGQGSNAHRLNFKRPPSPKRLQIVDRRRYQVPVHSPKWDKPSDRRPKTPDPVPGQRPKPKNMGVCWGCGKPGHYQGDPACKENGKTKPSQVYRMVDQGGNARDIRLFRISAEEMIADANEPNPEVHPNDDDIWEKYELQSHGNEENYSEPERWGGSQYESDPIDNEYMNDEHIGFMQEHSKPYLEY
ncbi:hypothetical protein F5878DRAFT_667490 [Lentinula raphanica]|uniref:Uncharacterized protein n=1 Tax=Lentinula raphanica TaxID=153919 RepID=A0AA38U9W6_9AGAR|nr:hypothetical protein F5878DRAFT_667490 [Lentinula raphanica]